MKNRGCIFFVCFFLTYSLYAQTNHETIDFLIQQAIENGAKNQDSAVYFSKKAHTAAKKEKDTFLLASAGYYYSFYLISVGKVAEAQKLLNFNLNNANQLPDDLNGNTHYNQAAIYDIREEFDDALQYYLHAIEFFKAANNKKGLAKSYLQIGVIYEKLGKTQIADYFFDASLKVSGNANTKHDVDSSGRGMSSEEKIRSSLKMLEDLENGDNKKLKSVINYNLGQSLMSAKRYSEAINYFERSLKLKTDIQFFTNIDKTWFLLGKCYYNTNDPENAIKNLTFAIQKNKKRNQKAEIAYYLSKSYETIKDYKNALLYAYEFKKISDSIAEFKQDERIAEITAKFENEKQSNKIIILQQENQRNELEIAKQENLRWRWSIFALVVSIIAVWFVSRFLQSQERIKVVESEKAHIAKKVEEIAVILNNKSKVYLKELKYIKSDGNYLEFVTDKKRIIDRNKIKAILKELPPNFVKVHRSYIINKNFVSSINRSSVILQPNINIPLSRLFKSNLV
ncbi:MAG: LytTR family transcriptional regulator [Winogradskyella sp.]|uniref:tetratricopeptide repeat protein n=1 Tax=Winogradskyella sp. TaxID=1883156 RepID=UPI0017C29EDD|nr:LytTR family transcriptional regulator [Winogradskyella sp.]